MIAELADYGMNAIGLVPYGFERPLEPMVHYSSGWERAELIEAVAALAHARGMKLLLKPQLWVHGYPGEIGFAQESDRARWFEQYRRF
jgi:hypothetical protein